MVSRAFFRTTVRSGLGFGPVLITVALSTLRGSAYTDEAGTGFVTFQRRSWWRTSLAAGALLAVAAAVAGLALIGVAQTLGLIAALAVYLLGTVLVVADLIWYVVVVVTEQEKAEQRPRGLGLLRKQLQLPPGARIWEVLSAARHPGYRTLAPLLITRALFYERLRPGDALVVKARTLALRRGYTRLGFITGPGDILVMHR